MFTGCKHVWDFQRSHPTRTQTKNRAKPCQLEPRSPQLPHRTSQTTRITKNPPRIRQPARQKENENRLNHPNPRGPRTPRLILDSNIITKLILNEPNSKEARATVEAYIEKGYTIHTVDLALTECLNIIWKHAKLFTDLSPEDTKSAIQYLLRIYDRLKITSTRDLAEHAIDIAQTTKIAVYDSTYIALTKNLNGILYTADKKLATTATTITKTKLLKPI